MSFHQSMRVAVAEGMNRIDHERQLDEEFQTNWQAVRRALWDVLNEAGQAVSEADVAPHHAISTRPQQKNGSSLFHFLVEGVSYELTFRPDPSTREIVCSTSRDVLPEERFTLDALGEDTMREKVLAFVKAALAHEAAKRPSLPRPLIR